MFPTYLYPYIYIWFGELLSYLIYFICISHLFVLDLTFSCLPFQSFNVNFSHKQQSKQTNAKYLSLLAMFSQHPPLRLQKPNAYCHPSLVTPFPPPPTHTHTHSLACKRKLRCFTLFPPWPWAMLYEMSETWLCILVYLKSISCPSSASSLS